MVESGIFCVYYVGEHEDIYQPVGLSGPVLYEIDEAAHLVRYINLSSGYCWWCQVGSNDLFVLEFLAVRVGNGEKSHNGGDG